MKVNELMIGDWVNVTTTNQPRKIKGTNDMLFHDEYDPIPLTEEILVKNGFDKYKRSKYFHVYTLNIKGSYDFEICWSSVNGFSYEGDFMINYVHQLQHLLRLVGVQKEIEL